MPLVERTPLVLIESLIVMGSPSSGRTSRPTAGGRLHRILGRTLLDQRDDGFEAMIDRFDPLDECVDHFDGRNVPGAEHRSQL